MKPGDEAPPGTPGPVRTSAAPAAAAARSTARLASLATAQARSTKASAAPERRQRLWLGRNALLQVAIGSKWLPLVEAIATAARPLALLEASD
jgi:hypothetical protein